MTSSTPGAEIQYQTNNISSYWNNGNTVTLTETTTLTARAILNGVYSEEAVKKVVFVPQGGSGGNIDELTNDLI